MSYGLIAMAGFLLGMSQTNDKLDDWKRIGAPLMALILVVLAMAAKKSGALG